MTKEEIIENGNFILNANNPKYSEFRITLYLNFFKQEQEIKFFNLPSLNSEPKMTVITDIVNELLNYDPINKEWLKDIMWKNFDISVKKTAYGMVPYEGFKNEEEANRAYFKIYNQEDAYQAVKLEEIWVDIDFTEFRHFNLSFECPWDNEHGISIGVKNGKFNSVN